MLFRYLCLSALLAAGFLPRAQTVITGTVTDAVTSEPMPFVNVAFKNGRSGTSTDMEGRYSLSSNFPADSLTASYIGYVPMTFAVVKNKKQGIDFRLQPSLYDLPEFEVRAPEENPAHVLLRRINARKEHNDKRRFSSYEYEVYTKIEFDLNNFDEKFRDRRVFRPFRFVFDHTDTAENGKPYLPLVLSESISDFYYRAEPKAQKEIIKASKVSGIENESVAQFTGDMYQDINVYDNFIVIFGKNFTSPIAGSGLAFYKYYLVDSAFFDGKWCYRLTFEPKRKQELVFIGHLWVHDTSFAVKSIHMEIAPGANLNYVDEMYIEQEFDAVKDSVWMLTKERLVVDFNLTDKTMGFFGRKTSMYRNFRINEARDKGFYGADNILVAGDASRRDDSYWQAARHEELSGQEKNIYVVVDSVKNLPVFRTYVDIITTFVTGYHKWGKIEMGPYYTTYSFNAIEGSRFRIGGRTSNKFSTKFEPGGYVAYGTKDEKFKYGAAFRYLFSKSPRQMIGAGYRYDLEQLGQSQNAFREDNIIASIFRRAPFDQLTQIEESKAYYEIEWFQGFMNRISLMHKSFSPLGSMKYVYYTDDSNTAVRNSISTAEVRFYTRFAYNEKYVSGEMDRVSLGTKYPVLQLRYTLGLPNLWGSDYFYHKLNFNMRHYFYIGPFGYTSYILDMGKVWGRLPYSLLELHQGNETYTQDEYAFNMMNYIEFVSDRYASVTATHHFDGFFLNKVPLFRKLKWREVVSGKALYGTLRDDNRDVIIFPETLSDLKTPYMEGSIGIENILKIIRLDVYRRFTHLDKADVPKFGLRGNLTVMF